MEAMKIAVAPSGFKECLAADEVAQAIADGVRRVVPTADVDLMPLVDGGEGSAKALAAATGGELVPVIVQGPTGEPVPSHFAMLGGGGPVTALVEMAAAAGLRLVPRDARDPGETTTYGVGELIAAALDAGAERIVIGCGDSGTSDGGAGALRALGVRLLDAHGRPVTGGGAQLRRIHTIDASGLDPRLARVSMEIAGNQHNLLCGEHGVARVFGPQKGATPRQVEELSDALEHWASLLRQAFGVDVRLLPGSGASGGLGAGLAAALGAKLLPRFDVLLDHVDLDARLAGADLVITAEGAIDFQTPNGKVPAEVARRAKRCGKPVIALAGTIGDGAASTHDVGIDAFTGILAAPVPLTEAMDQASTLLTDATERMLRLVFVGSSLGVAPSTVTQARSAGT